MLHLDNHPLGSRPVYMSDKARPHRARAVVEVLQQEPIVTSTMTSLQSRFNPTEHIFGCNIHQRKPPLQTVAELEAAFYFEANR